MLSLNDFIDRDIGRWQPALDGDYSTELELEVAYNSYLQEDRLDLIFLSSCVDPSAEIGGLNGLLDIIENMQEIEDSDSLEIKALKEIWNDEVGSYGTSAYTLSRGDDNLVIFVHSAIEYIYKVI